LCGEFRRRGGPYSPRNDMAAVWEFRRRRGAADSGLRAWRSAAPSRWVSPRLAAVFAAMPAVRVRPAAAVGLTAGLSFAAPATSAWGRLGGGKLRAVAPRAGARGLAPAFLRQPSEGPVPGASRGRFHSAAAIRGGPRCLPRPLSAPRDLRRPRNRCLPGLLLTFSGRNLGAFRRPRELTGTRLGRGWGTGLRLGAGRGVRGYGGAWLISCCGPAGWLLVGKSEGRPSPFGVGSLWRWRITRRKLTVGLSWISRIWCCSRGWLIRMCMSTNRGVRNGKGFPRPLGRRPPAGSPPLLICR
jgi:hypothetical protein